MAANTSWGDRIFGLTIAGLIVLSILLIGNLQANQYQKVVDRIDRNTQAVTCILLIDPTNRTQANVDACLAQAGLPTTP